MNHGYKIDNDVIDLNIEQDEYSFGQAENLGKNFDDLHKQKTGMMKALQ